MTRPGLSGPSRVGQDDRVPVLDLSPRIVHRRARGSVDSAAGWGVQLGGVLYAARWVGTVLPPADILGSVVLPVVSFTGAPERLRTGQGPMLDLETLDVWETMPTDQTPAAPLRIVGFIATATRWSTAVEQVRSLAGLGAGMVVTSRARSSLSLLDADATGVWVVGAPPCEPAPRLWVTGRVGPAATATRVTATRMMEEALFAHALDCGLVS